MDMCVSFLSYNREGNQSHDRTCSYSKMKLGTGRQTEPEYKPKTRINHFLSLKPNRNLL